MKKHFVTLFFGIKNCLINGVFIWFLLVYRIYTWKHYTEILTLLVSITSEVEKVNSQSVLFDVFEVTVSNRVFVYCIFIWYMSPYIDITLLFCIRVRLAILPSISRSTVGLMGSVCISVILFKFTMFKIMLFSNNKAMLKL